MASGNDSMVIVLAALAPVLVLSFGLLGYCWWHNRRKHSKQDDKTSDSEEQLAALQRRVDANADEVRNLSRALEANLSPTPGGSTGPRNRDFDGDLAVSKSSRGDGTIPHAAPGLENIPQSHSRSTNSAESFAQLRYTAPPSTIAEELCEDSTYSPSPFDTPTGARDGHGRRHEQQQQQQQQQRLSRFSFSSSSYQQLPLPGLSTTMMKSNPTHPDLVPAPLNLLRKGNSVRDETPRDRDSNISEGIDKSLLRRSLTSLPMPPDNLRASASGLSRGITAASLGDDGAVQGLLTPPPTVHTRAHPASIAPLSNDQVKPNVNEHKRRSQIPVPNGTTIIASARPLSNPQPCVSPSYRTTQKSAIPPHVVQTSRIPSPKPKDSVLSRPRGILQSPPPQQQQQPSSWTSNPTTTASSQYKPLAVSTLAHSSTAQSQLTESPSNMSLFVLDNTLTSPDVMASFTPRGSRLATGGSGDVLQSIKYVPSRASSQALPLPSFSRGPGLSARPTNIASSNGGPTITTAPSQLRSSKLANNTMRLDDRALTIRPVISIGDNNKKLLADRKEEKSPASSSLACHPTVAAHANEDDADKENNPPGHSGGPPQRTTMAVRASTSSSRGLPGAASLGRDIGGNLLDGDDDNNNRDAAKNTDDDHDGDSAVIHEYQLTAATPASVSLRLS
ncbi:hypothetical protein Micbo1qcDRAFT_220868 [Microdochium bolleyi]|uniref:Uncharacterized protein n=1 Tax=Microdochium bolleyi TaxID=196109 RepID=A0A136JAR0_9PEZI|nr:hypothetical protein Micbo1qcDRAFT_220868 [Microdochium bolleyi]